MVLTTLRVCLFNVVGKTCALLDFTSIGLGVFACLSLLIGCGEGGSPGGALPSAQPGDGNESSSHPTISVTPSHFAFAVTQGDANPVHTVIISDSGKGTLSWSASTTASWLTLSSSTGTVS